jgi:hypothetical protein
VTAADDPTLGGLLGPEPKRVEVCTASGCDRRDTIWGRCPTHTCLGDHGPRCDCPPQSALPSHVSVPGKTLADDAAEHDRGLTW